MGFNHTRRRVEFGVDVTGYMPAREIDSAEGKGVQPGFAYGVFGQLVPLNYKRKSKTDTIVVHHFSGSKVPWPGYSAAGCLLQMMDQHCRDKSHNSPDIRSRWGADGYGRPAYHVVLLPGLGMVQCLPLDAVGAHAIGANSTSIGICILGSYDYHRMQEFELHELARVVTYFAKEFSIDTNRVIGHREVPGTKKSCPGLLADMDEIRRLVRAYKVQGSV
jgi:hypothetical protein